MDVIERSGPELAGPAGCSRSESLSAPGAMRQDRLLHGTAGIRSHRRGVGPGRPGYGALIVERRIPFAECPPAGGGRAVGIAVRVLVGRARPDAAPVRGKSDEPA